MSIKIDLKRLEEEAIALEKNIPGADYLFYGSSTFTKWGQEKLAKRMKEEGATVLNHGFGGSTAEDALYHYGRLVKPFAPKNLVWYEGDNDIACGYTPEEAFDLSLRVFEWAKKDFVDIKLFLLSVKHCPLRWENLVLYNDYNNLLREYAKENANVFYIDMVPMCYRGKLIRTDIFEQDMLHFNDKGYDELWKVIKQGIFRGAEHE